MQLEAVGMGLQEPFHRSQGGVSPMPFGNGLGTRRHPARNFLVLSEPVEVHGFDLSVSGLSPNVTGETPDEYLEEIASQATAIPRMVVLRDSAPAGRRCGDAPPFRRTGHARNPGTREAGIATFRTPETCADALASALRRRPPRRIVGCVGGVDVAPLVGLGAGQAPLAGSLEMVAVLGAPPPASATIPVKDIYAAHEMSASISYPAVAKIVSSDILHKTEAGGVFVGAGNAMELAEACAAMVRRVGERRPDAALEAVTLETQEMGLTEAIVGYRVDPADDPAVTVGAGGVLAEIYRDVAMRPAPVNRREAQEMIGEVRAFAAICGYRSLPLGDVEALAGVVEAISRLACVTDVQVQEAEINPVLVKPEGAGVVSLDALFVIGDRG